jgi:glycosyltransferase involved in cell wall biosynthesis
MKLLVFAHTPPPHHGQSYMVKLMLDGLGGDVRRRKDAGSAAADSEIACYHVNARFSEDMEDIGTFRVTKALLVFRYCAEAIWCRFRHGVRAFYYVPAPGKRAALYRDWMVMFLCRPFFRDFIYHWHASGLGDWLKREGTLWERSLTHRLLGRPALGLALAIPSMRDALWFCSRRVEVVANGIPDPCANFDGVVLPYRQKRLAARRALLAGQTPSADERDACVFRVLYLAHCTREKGVFDTLEGVLLAQAKLIAAGSPLRFHLTIAGAFLDAEEETALRARFAQPDCAGPDSCISYVGFVSGEQKATLLRTSDAFCFPTYYPAEGQPVNLIEAMACGQTIITTRWRGIPEILPPDYPGFVLPQSPETVAEALIRALTQDAAAQLRHEFVTRFTEARYLQSLREVLSGIRVFSNDEDAP